ncbi:MAG: DUF1573 domain-containing protein [Oceanipulchritudo sp.]
MTVLARITFPVLAFLTCLSPIPASGEGKAEGLSWDKQVIQLPLEPSETSAEAWFTFSNETGEAIRIVDVQSDCDCLVPNMDRSVYYPGESGILLARVDVKEDQALVEKRVLVSSRMGKQTVRTTELLVIARRP